MDDFIKILKNSNKAEGKDKIYIAGEKEFELEEKYKEEVALYYKIVENLRSIGKELGIELGFLREATHLTGRVGFYIRQGGSCQSKGRSPLETAYGMTPPKALTEE